MTKTATVTQVDYARGMVKVALPELGSHESDWLNLEDKSYSIPPVGSQVMVTFDENDYSTGLCHGTYFSDANPPAVSGEKIYYLCMAGDVVIKYDAGTKTLEITADKVKLNGDVQISGKLDVSGDITAANFP